MPGKGRAYPVCFANSCYGRFVLPLWLFMEAQHGIKFCCFNSMLWFREKSKVSWTTYTKGAMNNSKNLGGKKAFPFPCGSFTFNTLISVARHAGWPSILITFNQIHSATIQALCQAKPDPDQVIYSMIIYINHLNILLKRFKFQN